MARARRISAGVMWDFQTVEYPHAAIVDVGSISAPSFAHHERLR
jgi:hypothetical protein